MASGPLQTAFGPHRQERLVLDRSGRECAVKRTIDEKAGLHQNNKKGWRDRCTEEAAKLHLEMVSFIGQSHATRPGGASLRHKLPGGHGRRRFTSIHFRYELFFLRNNVSLLSVGESEMVQVTLICLEPALVFSACADLKHSCVELERSRSSQKLL